MNEPFKILVIDDDYAIRDACMQILARSGSDVALAENGSTGLEYMGKATYDIVILDMKLPDMDGIEVLQAIHSRYPNLIIIVITAYPTVECAVKVMKMGAYDYIPKPFTPNLLRITVVKALDRRRIGATKEEKSRECPELQGPNAIIGESPAISQVKQFIGKAGMSDCSVLITGETGTGKELVARALHYCSRRRNNNFITVDSGGLVDTLIESELFGHVRGAFTGAYTDRVGRFEMAHRGTLFFDEISNMRNHVQSKLLRVLQEQEFSRVGSSQSTEINVRIIAATNRDLLSEIGHGNFREDLYYRLNVISIHLPPLRERTMDIPLLADYFLGVFRERKGSPFPKNISDTAIQKMISHDWPGNIRELKNLIERAVALCETPEVDPFEIVGGDSEMSPRIASRNSSLMQLADMEKDYIEKALKKFHNNKTKTAQMLGIDRKTLRRKIIKYGIPDVEDSFADS